MNSASRLVGGMREMLDCWGVGFEQSGLRFGVGGWRDGAVVVLGIDGRLGYSVCEME